MRERITITLEPDLVAAADALVDRSSIRNRSHALEHLIKEGLGLHLLRQAFFFVDEGWTQPALDSVVALCASQGIATVYLAAPAHLRSDIRTLIAAKSPDIDLQDVPLDFGSGGALVLKKGELAHPFLLAWISAASSVPRELTGAYLAHRQRNALATQLVVAEGDAYRPCGIAIAQPEILAYVPAGAVSLEATVFPELLKAGKLGTYAFSHE